jgi:hypothetical protein
MEKPMKQSPLFFLLLVLFGCTKDGTLTGPSAPTETPIVPPPAQTWYYVDFTGYGELLEPNYLKAYSDGSWEKYGGIDSVNGTAYLVLAASDSTRHYYTTTTHQYAGFRQPKGGLIMFTAPRAFLPTRWRSDTTVVLASSFIYLGYSVLLTTTYTLVDTQRVVTSLGSFSPVAHFGVRIDMQASSGDASSTYQEIWLARGPGGIEFKDQGRGPVFFVHGYVNGRSWGNASSVHKTAPGTVCTGEAFVKRILGDRFAGNISQ